MFPDLATQYIYVHCQIGNNNLNVGHLDMQLEIYVVTLGRAVLGTDSRPLKEQQEEAKKGQSVWLESITKSMHAGRPKIKKSRQCTRVE